MKKLYVLCLLTLAAVVLDIVFLQPRSVKAQGNATIRVERALFGTANQTLFVPVTGRVLGFHCVDTPGGPHCFVASGSTDAAGNVRN